MAFIKSLNADWDDHTDDCESVSTAVERLDGKNNSLSAIVFHSGGSNPGLETHRVPRKSRTQISGNLDRDGKMRLSIFLQL